MKEYRIGNEVIYLGTGAAEFCHSNKTTGENRRFFGIITWIEDRGDYLYIGYVPNDVSTTEGSEHLSFSRTARPER